MDSSVRQPNTNEIATRGRTSRMAAGVPAPYDGMQRAPAPPPAAQGFIDPKMLLKAFKHRWFAATFLGLVVGGICAGLAYYFTPAPYSSYAVLRVATIAPKVMFDTNESRQDFRSFIQTQIAYIRSPAVLGAALRRPEIGSLQIVKENEDPDPITWLEKELKVSNHGSSELLKIELSGEHPDDLYKLVNAIKDSYMEVVVNKENSNRFEHFNKLSKMFGDQEERIRGHRSQREKLAKALGSGDIATLSKKQQVAVDFFGQLQRRYQDLRFEIMDAQVELAAIQGYRDPNAKVEISDNMIEYQISQNQEFREKQQELIRLEEQMKISEKSFGDPNNPRLKPARDKIEVLKKTVADMREKLKPEILARIQEEIKARNEQIIKDKELQISFMSKQESSLKDEVEKHAVETKQQGVETFELEDITTEITRLNGMASTIDNEVKKLEVELNRESRITDFQSAEKPKVRENGRKYKMGILGGVAGFGLIVVLVTLLEARNRRISAVNEVVGNLRMRVIGTLPLMPKWIQKRGSGNSSRRAFWHSVLTESIDATRTLLIRDANLDQTRVVMVGSAMGSEGKTTLSCHLASSMARAGRATVLVDCDLRRPTAHKVFGQTLEPGFVDLLKKTATLDQVLRPTVEGGPWLLPAGRFTHDTTQLLATNQINEVFDLLRERFEFVIVDSAPALPVTDSLLIAQATDGVIIAVRRNVSRMSKVAAVCERYSMLGIPLLGAVAIGLDSEAAGYGYRYGYGYNEYNKYHMPANGRA